jgi:hypothetical protein
MTRWLVIALLLLFLPASAFAAADGAVSISASASTEVPYQNQSVLYTVRVVARAAVSNVSLSELRVANAIVERQDEPRVRRSTENGAPVNLVEFHFIITPLQPGPATIPPVILKGETETPDVTPSDQFGGGFMAGMLRAMNAISSLAGGQSFSAASNKTILNVRPPVAAINPWLPLASLKLTEDTPVAQSLRVGDLISRKITLSANGAVGSQLPDVEEQQNHRDFKVYTDKPIMGQTIDKTGVILASRTETFSLVPQHRGTLILPAVKVSWWNVVTNRVATAELPQRIINVLPGGTAQSSGNDDVDLARGRGMSRGAATAPSKSPGGILNSRGGLWKILETALIVSLLPITFWWLTWRRKLRFAGNDRGSVALEVMPRLRKARSDSTGVVALKQVREPEELKAFLQHYAHEYWGTAKNASLEKIFAAWKVPEVGSERNDIDALIERISVALYAGRPADIEDLKRRCQRVLMVSKKKRTSLRKGNQKKLACLNPD